MTGKEFTENMHEFKVKQFVAKFPDMDTKRARGIIKKVIYKDDSEGFLTKAVLDYVKIICGGVAFRISNEGRVRKIKKTHIYQRIPSTLPNGIADTYIELPRKAGGTITVWCELKTKKKTQGDDQIIFQNSIKSIGGNYIACNTLESFFSNFLPLLKKSRA